MQERVVHLTATKNEVVTLLLFCLAGIGLVLALFLAQLVTPAVMIALPLLAGGALFSISKRGETEPEYTLTEQGIHFGPHLRRPSIPWREVTAITTVTPCDSPPYVQLLLAADAAAWTTLSPLRKRLFRIYADGAGLLPAAYLYTAGLTMSHAQIVEILQQYWQQQKEAA